MQCILLSLPYLYLPMGIQQRKLCALLYSLRKCMLFMQDAIFTVGSYFLLIFRFRRAYFSAV